MIRILRSLLLAAALLPTGAGAAEAGLIQKPGRFSVTETVDALEDVLQRNGWTVFAKIDHAAAAAKAGVKIRPMVVVVFGNPRAGGLALYEKPTLGIDLPMKALVWVDEQGKVQLSYNSAAYVFGTLYSRHGLRVGADRVKAVEQLLDEMTSAAVR